MDQFSQAEQPASLNTTLQCSSCGATLHFAPGTQQLKCTYCGAANEIVRESHGPIVSIDYDSFIHKTNRDVQRTAKVVSCKNCGASTTLPPEVNSDNCTFCTSPLVISEAEDRHITQPHYILPFAVTNKQAAANFQTWMKKLWFAPSDLVQLVSNSASQLKGMYMPHWSYDADTTSDYEGSRGDYYYETEYYTENVNGQQVSRSRQVRHTSWRRVSGTVDNSFSNILVSASSSLPPKVAERLEPWHMQALEHYNEQYVSGFRSELYQIPPEDGLEQAKLIMRPVIENTIRHDIGGDEQRIDDYDNTYSNVALKYLMLPVWISAYKYNNKLYHFTVNASTGEVVGERPYSGSKIALLVIAIIAVVVAIIVLCNQ
jgi:LSD1 subclass zinc finger protein